MSRTARFQLPRGNASKFRRIVERQIALMGAVDRLSLCCDRWLRSGEEAAIKKLSRVMKRGEPLAYEDAWDVLDHATGPIVCADGRTVILFLNLLDVKGNKVDSKRLAASSAAVRKEASGRAVDIEKLIVQAGGAFEEAHSLLSPETAMLAVLPGESKIFAAQIERVVAIELGIRDPAIVSQRVVYEQESKN
jgi:hypothetical protein